MKKNIFLILLSSALLILSFPNFNLWILAWFGFAPLFLAIENKSKFKALLLSYLTGIIFWLGIIYWLAHVTLTGLIILVLYLALYFGFFGFIFSTTAHRPSIINLFFIPSVWVLLEYLRSHLFTGFPWALLGYAQCLNLPVIQIADITGPWGVSFLVMLVNVAIYSVISYQLSVINRIKKCFISLICVIIIFAYGYYRLYHRPSTTGHRPIKISVVQANIPQELKWNPQSNNYIMRQYFAVSREVIKDHPDLIIWPEAALPVVLEEEPAYYEEVKDFVKKIKLPLLLGAVTKRHNLYYNSALLVSREGELLSRYDKLHLVPFGEYIPLRKIFGFLETVAPIGDFSAGREFTVFNLPAKFSVLICFEDLFPNLSREFVKKGAEFLINITNDAWFKETSSPYQHLQASVFRAVENRVFVVRSANTGVSGFIAPSGKIMSLVGDEFSRNIFIPGYKTKKVLVCRQNLSFYSRYGDFFVIVCFLFVLLFSVVILKKKR